MAHHHISYRLHSCGPGPRNDPNQQHRSRAGSGSYYPVVPYSVVDAPASDVAASNSIHHHEKLHAKQYATTTYGLFSYMAATRQAVLAARAFRHEHPLVGVRYSKFERLGGDDPLHEIRDSDLRAFFQFSELIAALDGREPKFLGSAATWSDLAQATDKAEEIESHLPAGLWQRTERSIKSATDVALAPATKLTPRLGAAELFESGAIAAQLLLRDWLQNRITGKESRYRGAQLAFFHTILPFLADVSTLTKKEAAHAAANLQSHRQPLEVLFDLLDQRPRTRRVRSIGAGAGALQLFCVLVDLALQSPIGSWFRTLGTQLAWHDVHPGWRFLRILQVVDAERRAAAKKRHGARQLLAQMIENPLTLRDQISGRLRWPTSEQMKDALSSWLSETDAHERFCGNPFETSFARARMLAAMFGLERQGGWVDLTLGRNQLTERFSRQKPFGTRQRDQALPEEVTRTWSLEKGIVIDRRRGVCVGGPGGLRVEDGNTVFRFDPSTMTFDWHGGRHNTLLANTRSDMTLADAILGLPFHHEVLQMAVWGSGGNDAADFLAKKLCSDQAASWSDVRQACHTLVDKVQEKYIWT